MDRHIPGEALDREKTMPIIQWPTSVKQARAFQTGLDQLVERKRIPDGLRIMPPLPVYNIGLRDLVMSSGLDAAGKLVSWRYFAGGDSAETTVSGDIDLSANPRLTSLAYGKQVFEAFTAFKKTLATKLAEKSLANVDFEPRLLRFPSLLLECLWTIPLRPPGAARGDDWVLPYHKPTNDFDLDSSVLYRGEDLFQTLQVFVGKERAKSRQPNILPKGPPPHALA